jgi:hypothetical protein
MEKTENSEKSAETCRVSTSLSKSLLNIDAELVEFKKNLNPEISNCVIRAYGLPEKLT